MDREAAEVAERLESIIESAVDGILTIDEAGTIESVNAACIKIFGYDRSELVGSKVNRLMPDRDAKEHDKYLANYLRSGHSKIIGAGRNVLGCRKDGTRFPLYLAVSEGTYEGRKLFTGIFRDLTELRRAEERAKAAEQQASFAVVAAGIAHDIGTPMNVILGYADMLHDSLADPQDRRRAAVISAQVSRVTAILQTLLNIARPDTSVKSPVQIGEVLDHALDFCQQRLMDGKVEVERRVEEVPPVIGDRDRLEQMCLHLIVNAVDAMPEGGKLTAIVELAQDKRIRIVLADTGHGIAADVRAHIFEPFYTTRGGDDRSGLGLVVAHSIVSDHAGTIECESELEKGTRFVIRLPTTQTRSSANWKRGMDRLAV